MKALVRQPPRQEAAFEHVLHLRLIASERHVSNTDDLFQMSKKRVLRTSPAFQTGYMLRSPLG